MVQDRTPCVLRNKEPAVAYWHRAPMHMINAEPLIKLCTDKTIAWLNDIRPDEDTAAVSRATCTA